MIETSLGLSGDLVYQEGKSVVKICKTNQARFIKNTNKQISSDNPFICPVPITEIFVQDGCSGIRMPCLTSNSLDWLLKSDKDQLDLFINQMRGYFNHLISKSTPLPFDYTPWLNKVHELTPKIKDAELAKVLKYLEYTKFKGPCQYGDYHGDLTLCNLFIYNCADSIEIDAIDFLESFICSPINDLAKIRQDTKHHWLLTLTKNISESDVLKIKIALNYVDEHMVRIIASDQFYMEYYLPFQIMNLMRIIPYNKDERVFVFLKQEIMELYNGLSTNNAMCR